MRLETTDALVFSDARSPLVSPNLRGRVELSSGYVRNSAVENHRWSQKKRIDHEPSTNISLRSVSMFFRISGYDLLKSPPSMTHLSRSRGSQLAIVNGTKVCFGERVERGNYPARHFGARSRGNNTVVQGRKSLKPSTSATRMSRGLRVFLRMCVRCRMSVQGCFSLSATPTNILMWSHYAQNHEGYVIGFDADHEYFGESVSPVAYSSVRPSHDPFERRHSGAIFYTKSSDWSYEQEYRKFQSFGEPIKLENGNYLSPYPPRGASSGQKNGVFLFPIPPDSISSVILGWKSGGGIARGDHFFAGSHELQHVEIYVARPSANPGMRLKQFPRHDANIPEPLLRKLGTISPLQSANRRLMALPKLETGVQKSYLESRAQDADSGPKQYPLK